MSSGWNGQVQMTANGSRAADALHLDECALPFPSVVVFVQTFFVILWAAF